MKRKIIALVFFIIAVGVNFNEYLHNLIIPPVGSYLYNLFNQENNKLKLYSIKIHLPETKWVYSVSDYDNDLIVYFVRNPVRIKNTFVKFYADLHLNKKPLEAQEFDKVLASLSKNCTQVIDEKFVKKGQVYTVRYCEKANENFQEVFIIKKNNYKVYMVFYPFYKKSKEILDELLKGISF
jgi:hypothetical protein